MDNTSLARDQNANSPSPPVLPPPPTHIHAHTHIKPALSAMVARDRPRRRKVQSSVDLFWSALCKRDQVGVGRVVVKGREEKGGRRGENGGEGMGGKGHKNKKKKID